MATYRITLADPKKPIIKAMPSANYWEMHNYAESSVIQKAKDGARKVGATRFSITKDGRLMGMWIFNMSNGRWSRMIGTKWW